ncbi:MAG: DUF167 domain-containing protein [Lentisphaeria bacterium]
MSTSRDKKGQYPAYIKQLPESVILLAYVQPGAKRTEVNGIHDGRLKIRIQTPPSDGKANKELCRFLARPSAKRSQVHVGSAGGSSRAFALQCTTLRGNALQRKSPRGAAAAPTRRACVSFGDLSSFRRKPLAYG